MNKRRRYKAKRRRLQNSKLQAPWIYRNKRGNSVYKEIGLLIKMIMDFNPKQLMVITNIGEPDE